MGISFLRTPGLALGQDRYFIGQSGEISRWHRVYSQVLMAAMLGEQWHRSLDFSLNDGNAGVRKFAREALSRIDSPAAREALNNR